MHDLRATIKQCRVCDVTYGNETQRTHVAWDVGWLNLVIAVQWLISPLGRTQTLTHVREQAQQTPMTTLLRINLRFNLIIELYRLTEIASLQERLLIHSARQYSGKYSLPRLKHSPTKIQLELQDFFFPIKHFFFSYLLFEFSTIFIVYSVLYFSFFARSSAIGFGILPGSIETKSFTGELGERFFHVYFP